MAGQMVAVYKSLPLLLMEIRELVRQDQSPRCVDRMLLLVLMFIVMIQEGKHGAEPRVLM
jgi:hypothetical protein